jgi:hypothetical protein
VAINARWNLVSNPVIALNDSVFRLFPSSGGPAFFYDPASGYHLSDLILNGPGYWLRFPADTVAVLAGSSRLADTIDVSDGWNLIGSLSRTIPASFVQTIGTTVTSRLFGYASSYQSADSIRPGAGYWLKVNQAGKVVLSVNGGGSTAPLAQKESPGAVSMNKLIVTDARGSSQTLYFGAGEDAPLLPDPYALPPVPPAGVFDVRFASQRLLATYSPVLATPLEIPVVMNAAAYPVTVRWELDGKQREAFSLRYDDGGKPVKSSLRTPAGDLTISDEQSQPLLLGIAEAGAMPVRTALRDNYPNPFNPTTVIRYELRTESRVELKVFDLLGQEVKTLVDAVREAGSGSIEWNSTNNGGNVVVSGVYFYRFTATSIADPGDTYREVKRMVLIR